MRMADAKEPGNVRNYCGNNNSLNEKIQALTCRVARMRTQPKLYKRVGSPRLWGGLQSHTTFQCLVTTDRQLLMLKGNRDDGQ